ncbi:hypothetical protein WJX75_005982 [Coccomyxa subellipsoidea]|uniref:Uncharacterized protein n=1 Tax=Coccomyxa subellipsoidea TaxID=248742 RepID=A0ABR2YF38_9CHLO
MNASGSYPEALDVEIGKRSPREAAKYRMSAEQAASRHLIWEALQIPWGLAVRRVAHVVGRGEAKERAAAESMARAFGTREGDRLKEK